MTAVTAAGEPKQPEALSDAAVDCVTGGGEFITCTGLAASSHTGGSAFQIISAGRDRL